MFEIFNKRKPHSVVIKGTTFNGIFPYKEFLLWKNPLFLEYFKLLDFKTKKVQFTMNYWFNHSKITDILDVFFCSHYDKEDFTFYYIYFEILLNSITINAILKLNVLTYNNQISMQIDCRC